MNLEKKDGSQNATLGVAEKENETTSLSEGLSQEEKPVKRGRGRPRKNPLPEENKTQSKSGSKTDEAEEKPVKRGRGRPRKTPVPTESANEKEQEKRTTDTPEKTRLQEKEANKETTAKDKQEDISVTQSLSFSEISEQVASSIRKQDKRSDVGQAEKEDNKPPSLIRRAQEARKAKELEKQIVEQEKIVEQNYASKDDKELRRQESKQELEKGRQGLQSEGTDRPISNAQALLAAREEARRAREQQKQEPVATQETAEETDDHAFAVRERAQRLRKEREEQLQENLQSQEQQKRQNKQEEVMRSQAQREETIRREAEQLRRQKEEAQRNQSLSKEQNDKRAAKSGFFGLFGSGSKNKRNEIEPEVENHQPKENFEQRPLAASPETQVPSRETLYHSGQVNTPQQARQGQPHTVAQPSAREEKVAEGVQNIPPVDDIATANTRRQPVPGTPEHEEYLRVQKEAEQIRLQQEAQQKMQLEQQRLQQEQQRQAKLQADRQRAEQLKVQQQRQEQIRLQQEKLQQARQQQEQLKQARQQQQLQVQKQRELQLQKEQQQKLREEALAVKKAAQEQARLEAQKQKEEAQRAKAEQKRRREEEIREKLEKKKEEKGKKQQERDDRQKEKNKMTVAKLNTAEAKRKRRRRTSILGFVTIVIVIVGIFTVGRLLVSTAGYFLTGENKREEYEKYIKPVVMMDPATYDDPSQLKVSFKRQTAIWSLFMSGNKERFDTIQEGEKEFILVPAAEIDAEVTKLFGETEQAKHESFGDEFFMFYYDAERNGYKTPITGKTGYVPKISKIEKDGSDVKLFVGYIPTNAWQAGTSQSTDEVTPEKTMIYVIGKKDGNKYIKSVQPESGGGPVQNTAPENDSKDKTKEDDKSKNENKQ